MKLTELFDALGKWPAGSGADGRLEGVLTQHGTDDGLGGVGLASTSSNIFGGQDIFHNGVMVGSTTPNIFGGVDDERQLLLQVNDNYFCRSSPGRWTTPRPG